MTRRTLIRSDFASHREFPSDAESAQMGLRSSIMVPLTSQGQVIGTLGLRSQEVNAYGGREQAILERLAKQIAPALENSALYEQIVQDRQEKAAAVENLRQAYAYLDSIMLNLPADCDIWSSLSTMNRGRTVWANPGNGGAKFTLLIMDGPVLRASNSWSRA